jgi:Skp family chaperone for outer membrane proteins
MKRLLDLLISDIVVSLNFYKQGHQRIKIVCQLNPELALMETKTVVIRSSATVNETLAAIQKSIKDELDKYRADLAAEQAGLNKRVEMLRKFDAISKQESDKPTMPTSRRKLQVKQADLLNPGTEEEEVGWEESLEDLI